MKIIVLGLRGFPNVQGGVEAHCENLYPLLVKLGCDVTVITRAPYVDPKVIFYQGVRLVALDCPRNKFLEALWHTFKGVLFAKRTGCDIVHIHAIGPSLCVLMARSHGLKVVVTHHGPDYERKKWNGLAKLILKLGEWQGCVFANEVIAVSRSIADQIKKRYGRKVAAIPNGVVIGPEKIETEGGLNRFGLKKNRYVLAVGRFVPEKGFEDLMDAFLSAFGAGNPAGYKLVIVGDADHADAYSAKLKEKAAQSGDIILTGRLSGLPLKELYVHAGMFVLPSYYEGLPIVFLEALSYGVSCLVSDIPSNKEIGIDRERYFAAGDVGGLAKAMLKFINQPLTALQKDAQIKMVFEKYNWKTIAEETFGVYEKALGRNRLFLRQ